MGWRYHLFPPIKGWLNLAVVIDLYSRRIVGWALAGHLRAGLFTDALRQALHSRLPPAACGFILHRGRGPGSQYPSREYRGLPARCCIRQSSSAKGDFYHNSWAESFMGTLKTAMLQDGCFVDAADARTGLFGYIESYYNHHRRHSSLASRTPAQFEACKRSPV